MTFSILFWNIWFYNQIEGDPRLNRLLHEFDSLAQRYKPDFIALTEVVRNMPDRSVPVIEHLEKLDYSHNRLANMAQFGDNWLAGVTLSSRYKMNRMQHIVLSKHGFAAKHGYPGLNEEAISAQVILPGNEEIKIIVVNPLPTIGTLNDHKVAMKNLNRLIHSGEYGKNTILVGDMNEWRLMPGAFRHKVANVMHSRTGSILNPTWRHNAHRFTPLRLNLDYVYWDKRSDFSLKDFKVLSSTVSDHRPLLATFEI